MYRYISLGKLTDSPIKKRNKRWSWLYKNTKLAGLTKEERAERHSKQKDDFYQHSKAGRSTRTLTKPTENTRDERTRKQKADWQVST